MELTTFKVVKKTNIALPFDLGALPCGLHRCSLDEAEKYLPDLKELYNSAPVSNHADWEIDVKIHMLMKGQYPCIPNWHCDNVPRDQNGKLQYHKIDNNAIPMYLWVSNGPCTEFMESDTRIGFTLEDHGQISHIINEYEMGTKFIEPQTWISMQQNTPHRGTVAKNYSWRVFARLTHKSIMSARPVVSVVRRHAQVYLDASTFTW